MDTVLVVGSNSFSGASFVDYALEQGARVSVKFIKGGYNLRRLGFYWVMLSVAADLNCIVTNAKKISIVQKTSRSG